MSKPYLFLFLLSAACRPSGPAHETVVYFNQLQPLLDENSLLADRVLDAAAQVHDGRSSPTTAAAAWDGQVVPLARHLHDQAAMVQPPGPWVDPHADLVRIWQSRAEGYGLVSEAIRKGDEARWRRGRSLADKAKLDEEAWFNTLNARLAPEGLELDQYP